MFFEKQHSLNENEFLLYKGSDIRFPVHIHRSFEYFEQIQGTTLVTVENKKYLLQAGEAVLIFPLQYHSYQSVKSGRIRLCIFSPDMVGDFYKAHKNHLPSCNKLPCALPEKIDIDNLFQKKSVAYLICGEFEKDRSYAERAYDNSEQLLISLLVFADENFTNQCLLRDAAAIVGYDYAYISKIFKKRVGVSFRQYVNELRIEEAKKLLADTSKSIEEIVALSGFSSLRSFDREFKANLGITPSEYKKAATKNGFSFALQTTNQKP
jgi:AraC-like DNA-binding protein